MAKTVLVTGGARRIGRAIAKSLASAGWRVLVHARREGDSDALALADEIGGHAFFADFTEPLAPARLFNAVCAAEPEISALVNNAAVFSPSANLPPPEADRIMAVNSAAPEKLMTMLALRLMTNDERGPSFPRSGAVVNLLDAHILCVAPLCANSDRPQDLATERHSVYLKSKLDLLAAQRKVAMQFASVLRVNGVAPGPVLAPANAHEKGGETLLDSRPSPEDVAEAVKYLLSAKSVTGAVIPVDSGQHLLSGL